MSAIDWAHTYRPRVVMGSTSFDLPLPIMQTSERFTQRVTRIEVPKQNGVLLSGMARGALDLSFQGIISKNTLSGLLETKDALHELLINSGGIPFTLYRYYDAARQNYRWYEDCVCSNLQFEWVNRQVYTMSYNFQVVVPSGIEKALVTTTGEAANILSGNISGLIQGGVVQGDNRISFVSSINDLPEDRVLLYGPLIVKLPDSDGTSAFLIYNGDGDIIFKVRSDGRVETIKPLTVVRDAIAYP